MCLEELRLQFLGRRGMPVAEIANLERQLLAICATEEPRSRLYKQGIVLVAKGRADFKTAIAHDAVLNRDLVTTIGGGQRAMCIGGTPGGQSGAGAGFLFARICRPQCSGEHRKRFLPVCTAPITRSSLRCQSTVWLEVRTSTRSCAGSYRVATAAMGPEADVVQ